MWEGQLKSIDRFFKSKLDDNYIPSVSWGVSTYRPMSWPGVLLLGATGNCAFTIITTGNIYPEKSN